MAFEILSIEDNCTSLELKMEAKNEFASTNFTFYISNEAFFNLGDALSKFPKTINDRFSFQVGENSDSWAYYLIIELFCFSNGKIALKIFADNHGKGTSLAQSLFYIESYAYSLVKLGQKIKTQAKNLTTRIEWESDV